LKNRIEQDHAHSHHDSSRRLHWTEAYRFVSQRWHQLMCELGYSRYGAGGNDFGSGVTMLTIQSSDYDCSQPDPLADSMAEIIQHMNADHKDALVLLARQFAHIESTEATMTTVDRLGFHVRLKTPDGMRGARIAFLKEVSNPAETRKVLVEMVRQARSRAE
jgi:Protein of unknown function (DUF2470)